MKNINDQTIINWFVIVYLLVLSIFIAYKRQDFVTMQDDLESPVQLVVSDLPSNPPLVPIGPVIHNDEKLYTERELVCLALDIYHEARGEGDFGMLIAGNVVINRARHELWPKNLCSVVKQKINGVGQFSWYHDGKPDFPHSKKEFRKSLRMAAWLATPPYVDLSGGALFYHADYVNPNWNYQKLFTHNHHIFYTIKEANG